MIDVRKGYFLGDGFLEDKSFSCREVARDVERERGPRGKPVCAAASKLLMLVQNGSSWPGGRG